jgi:hypothetical protein
VLYDSSGLYLVIFEVCMKLGEILYQSPCIIRTLCGQLNFYNFLNAHALNYPTFGDKGCELRTSPLSCTLRPHVISFLLEPNIFKK